MRAVLTHPTSGYYLQGDVFGQKGDFTTSPEISPLFGEMLGVWVCNEFSKIGSPRPLQYVELGPGRGTLASDILRVLRKLPPGPKDVTLHLVEVSDRLAQIQAARLGVADLTTMLAESSLHYQEGITEDGVQIYWYKTLENVPRGFSLFIAHEFFDALPIHKFQKVNGSWREILVGLKMPDADVLPEFVFALSRGSSPTYSVLIKENETREHIEISPDAAKIVDHMGMRIEEDGGIALIIDYGHSGDKTDTFRGFKNHALHDPLQDPGCADLTADVDFSFLIRSAGQRVFPLGPVPQGVFLKRLGIETRLSALTQRVSAEQAEDLRSGVQMIVEDMGNRFQCVALFPAVLSEHLRRYPVSGFQD